MARGKRERERERERKQEVYLPDKAHAQSLVAGSPSSVLN